MVQAFGVILFDYTDNEITAAFLEWMKTKPVLPTPSDILAICEISRAERNRNTEDFSAAREATRKRLQAEYDNFKPMPEGEFEGYLAKIKQELKPEAFTATSRKGIDTKHFDSMSEEAKQAIIGSVQESLANLRKSQGGTA